MTTTTTDKDRMLLAKFCGAEFATIDNGSWANVNIPGGKAFKDWNPFKSADDDYAVLEWAREQELCEPTNERFSMNMHLPACVHYQIGDYARACLKVLDDV